MKVLFNCQSLEVQPTKTYILVVRKKCNQLLTDRSMHLSFCLCHLHAF